MIELVVTASAGRLRNYLCQECNGLAESVFWFESDDTTKYEVNIESDHVCITTKMPNIEVVDTDVTVGIPTEVWDVLRGI